MISSDVNLDKTKTLLLYLSIAKHKIDQREIARQKLAAQISALKKISTSSIKKHVVDLEKDIAEAIAKEKRIASVQKTEDEYHRELVNKIDMLESKLGKYLETKDARKKRILALEQKIKKKMASRKEQLAELRDSIKNLEKLYAAAKKDKKVSRMRLRSIEAKIKKLKKKLKIKAKKL
jgi:chromosome segregation ATPase